jgi:hypothetical protein
MSSLLVDGNRVAGLEIAATARARGKGLLGRTGLDGALLLRPCRHVHTMRMKFTIDVANLDKTGTVISVETLRPNRFARFHRRTRTIVEAEGGAFAAWDVKAGVLIRALPDA